MDIYVPTASNRTTITLTISGAGTTLEGQYLWLDGRCFLVTNQTLNVVTAEECMRAPVLKLKPKAQPHWVKYNDWRKKTKR